MVADLANHAECDRGNGLPPEPQPRAPCAVLLDEIAHDRVRPIAEIRQDGHGDGRRLLHTNSPFSSGMPFHNATNARWVLRTARRPAGVTRKNFLARPPRSGVASPSRAVTRPFSCRRARARYTAPSVTPRPAPCSLS